MIIQCDNCNTKFRLDDSKITETGVRVRCSRCSHTFIVHKEAPADEDAFDTLLAGFGAPADGGEPPEQAGRSQEPGVNTEPAVQDHGAEASGEGTERDVSPVPEPAPSFGEPETPAEVPAPPEPFAGFFQKGVSLPQFRESEEPADKVESGIADVPAASFPGREPETASEVAAPPEPFAGFFREGVSLPQFRASGEPSEQNQESEPEMDHGQEDTTPLETAETAMDVSPAGEVEIGQSVSSEPGSPPSDEWGILAAASTAPEDEQQSPSASLAARETEYVDMPPLSIASRRQSSPFPILLLGLLLVLIVVGTATVFFLKWPVDPATIVPSSVMKMLGLGSKAANGTEIRSLDGVFLVNRQAGEILVITGEVFNSSGKALTSLRVKGTVYDSAGQVLAQRTVYCGNTLSREQLSGMPFSDLEKAMGSQFGESLANLDVAAGKSIPFTIVFKGVPKGGMDFGVEVVGRQGLESGKR